MDLNNTNSDFDRGAASVLREVMQIFGDAPTSEIAHVMINNMTLRVMNELDQKYSMNLGSELESVRDCEV